MTDTPNSAKTLTSPEPPLPSSFTRRVTDALRPANLVPGFLAGGVTGIVSIIGVIAFASLIFSGPYAAHLVDGIGYFLLGTIAIGLGASLLSSSPGIIAGIQDIAIAITAALGLTLLEVMPPDAAPDQLFVTLMAAIALSSLFTGVVFLALGFLRLGNLIRYFPYPVIGGFLGGTGLSLVRGGISVMAGAPIGVALTNSTLITLWLPGFVAGAVMLWAALRFQRFWTVPAVLAVEVALFYAIVLLAGIPIPDLMSGGWLVGEIPSGSLFRTLPLNDLALVNWQALLSQAGTFVSLSVIMVITLLLNSSGIELQTRRDMDLNQELKASGVANILAALTGTPAGTHYLGSSTLVHQMGAHSRLPGIIQSLLAAVMLFAGASVLSFFPMPVLGGLLIFFGLSFLRQWVYATYFSLPRTEYAVVLLITLVVYGVGFLEGVTLGAMLALILFAVNYSRINVIKHELSGANLQSTVDRPRLYRDLFVEKAHWLYMLKLQGFIFFGTANRLFNQFRLRVNRPDLQKPRYFMLDFNLVTGVDSSALISFEKMLQFAEQNDITLIFTALSPGMLVHLNRDAFAAGRGQRWFLFPDLDHGIEWYENQVIEDFESVGFAVRPPSMTKQLTKMLPDDEAVNTMMYHFEQRKLESGMVIVRQGNPPDGMYFIEEGKVQVRLELPQSERSVRLRTMSSGTVFGDLGTYLDVPSTATVVADTDVELFFLSTDKLKLMENEHPEIAAAFHRFMALVIAERLASAAETLKILLD